MFKYALALYLLVSTASIGEITDEFDPVLRTRMDAMISVFENDTPILQYGYIEDIHDERGFTAGRAGFTTASGDLLQVVEKYTELKPRNSLTRLIPRLKEIARTSSPFTTGLEALPALWKLSAQDPDFRKAQDEIVDEDYFFPALEMAKKYNIKTPLGIFIFYDAMIQHGDGDDADSFDSIARTIIEPNIEPLQREEKFLRLFLQSREKILSNPSNQGTRENWKESIIRVKILERLLDEQNFQLKPPIEINVYGEDYEIL